MSQPLDGASADAASSASGAGLPMFDADALLADIERDVRERRRSGAITPEYEAELAGAFAEVAPNGSIGGGFDEVVGQAARHAIVDYDAPIAGSRPLRFVKRMVKLLTAWYLIFVGRQLVAFAGTTLRALRLLGARVDELEHNAPATDPRLKRVSAPVATDIDLGGWHEACVAAIAVTPAVGRVLHVDCGSGALLAALHDRGIDAYGVDNRTDAGALGDARAIEIRGDEALTHIQAVAPGSLRAVVLSGCVDRLGLGDKVDLLHSARKAVQLGGVVLLIGLDPRATRGNDATLASDLAPGRALHNTTWSYLLESVGFDNVVIAQAPSDAPEAISRHADPAVRALGAVVFVATTFCISALRAE